MKQLLLAFLFSIFMVPHFSVAAENVASQTAASLQHAVHRSPHSKSQYTQSVNVNQADASQLMTLKGVGEKRATAIVAYRQAHGAFKAVSDLSQVRGIGVKGLARLQANNPDRITINTSQNLK